MCRSIYILSSVPSQCNEYCLSSLSSYTGCFVIDMIVSWDWEPCKMARIRAMMYIVV